MINKKGELTTQQIIGLIVLIVSFGVIMGLIFRLGLSETNDSQICHNSVLLKEKSSGFSGDLDCKTRDICISNGDKCERFDYDILEKVNGTKEDTGRVLDDLIENCWWMFGEGKVDYIGDWINKPDSFEIKSCAICNVVRFDKKIQDKFSNLKYGNIEIVTSEKYYVITGMKDKGDFIPSKIVSSSELDELNCDEYITKA